MIIFGNILVYSQRTFIDVNMGLLLMILWYHGYHRMLHVVTANLHFAFHHHHLVKMSRNMELIIDFIVETLTVILIPYLIQRNYNSSLIPFSTMVFVSLAFSLNHILNYSFFPSKKHTTHHLSESTNFYPDFMDHLFNTNSDPEYEDMTQHIPSLVQACIITHFAKAYFQWKD